MTSFECTSKAADRHLWSALHVDRPSKRRWHSQVIQVIDTGILRVMSILTQVINTITYVNIDIIHWHQWCHIWHPYWVRLGPNGSLSQNVLKLILKSPRFVPFWPNLNAKYDIPDEQDSARVSVLGLTQFSQIRFSLRLLFLLRQLPLLCSAAVPVGEG